MLSGKGKSFKVVITTEMMATDPELKVMTAAFHTMEQVRVNQAGESQVLVHQELEEILKNEAIKLILLREITVRPKRYLLVAYANCCKAGGMRFKVRNAIDDGTIQVVVKK